MVHIFWSSTLPSWQKVDNFIFFSDTNDVLGTKQSPALENDDAS